MPSSNSSLEVHVSFAQLELELESLEVKAIDALTSLGVPLHVSPGEYVLIEYIVPGDWMYLGVSGLGEG